MHSPTALPLFPLRTVLFSDGMLALKIFEARYLDLVSTCLREQRPFGVVCVIEGGEVRQQQAGLRVESVGTLAHLEEVDSDQPGILHIRCRGGDRFRLEGVPAADASGLWSAPAQLLAAPEPVAPSADDEAVVDALAEALERLEAQREARVFRPLRFDDAGWVADRWCELLPISVAARQKMLELDDAALRLQLIRDFLRQKKVIG